MDVKLANGENIISETEVLSNPLFFWVKTKYILTNKRVLQYTPNFIVGIIPFGINEVSQPLNAVSTVRISTAMYIRRLISGLISLFFGLLMSLFGLGMLFENVIIGIFIFLFGAFILITGALVTVMCYVTTFSVEGSGGHTGKIFEFWYKERTKLENLSDEVNSLLANQQSKLTSV